MAEHFDTQYSIIIHELNCYDNGNKCVYNNNILKGVNNY